MIEDRCVCCGAVVPEGRMICQTCEGLEDDIIRRMSNRIRYLEEMVRYHETTIRMIYADAAGETESAREKENTNSILGNAHMSEVYRTKAEERKRLAERIKSICLRRNFDPEKMQ